MIFFLFIMWFFQRKFRAWLALEVLIFKAIFLGEKDEHLLNIFVHSWANWENFEFVNVWHWTLYFISFIRIRNVLWEFLSLVEFFFFWWGFIVYPMSFWVFFGIGTTPSFLRRKNDLKHWRKSKCWRSTQVKRISQHKSIRARKPSREDLTEED